MMKLMTQTISDTRKKVKKKLCHWRKDEQKQATKLSGPTERKSKKTKRINTLDPQPSAIHTHQLEPIPKMGPIVAPIRLSSPK